MAAGTAAVAAPLRARLALAALGRQVLGVDEQVAGVDERLGGLLLADAHDEEAFLADARRQARVVAVRRHDGEPLDQPAVHDVHGVDDQGAVGGVLAHGVAELLDGLHGVHVQGVLPGVHVLGGPVAVDAADGHRAVLGDLGQHLVQQRGLGVVAVDEHGHLVVFAFYRWLSHILSPVRREVNTSI